MVPRHLTYNFMARNREEVLSPDELSDLLTPEIVEVCGVLRDPRKSLALQTHLAGLDRGGQDQFLLDLHEAIPLGEAYVAILGTNPMYEFQLRTKAHAVFGKQSTGPAAPGRRELLPHHAPELVAQIERYLPAEFHARFREAIGLADEPHLVIKSLATGAGRIPKEVHRALGKGVNVESVLAASRRALADFHGGQEQ